MLHHPDLVTHEQQFSKRTSIESYYLFNPHVYYCQFFSVKNKQTIKFMLSFFLLQAMFLHQLQVAYLQNQVGS